MQHGPGQHMSEHKMPPMKKASYEVALKVKRQIAEETMEFVFEKPKYFAFKAGQHIRMTLINPPETDAEGNSRFFSLASTPQDKDLVIAMRMRDTAFKRVLKSMKSGTKVLIQILLDAPHGAFALHDDHTKPAVYIVGGIGIVPAYSMIKDATERKLSHKLVLFYSNRRPEDAPYLTKLEKFTKQNPNFKLVATMTGVDKSAEKWRGETARINQAMLEKYLDDLQAPIYYVSGLPEIVSSMQSVLKAAGVSESNIQAEEFRGFNLNEITDEAEKQTLKSQLPLIVLVTGILGLILIHATGVRSVLHGGFGSLSFSNPLSYFFIAFLIAVIAFKIKLILSVRRGSGGHMAMMKAHGFKQMQISNDATKEPAVRIYSCPMHPDVQQESSGICPKCKMGLVATKSGHATHSEHSHMEHDKHAGHSVNMFKDKFWISLLLTIPVLIYSEMIQHWLRFMSPAFPGSEYVPFILSSVIFFYGGLVFIKSALGELKAKQPGMMTLISLAIVTAYAYSVATQFFIAGEGFFWELATLVTIMLLGHWLEMASVMKAESALDAIKQLLPDQAEKLVKGKPQRVLVSELKVGDLLLVRPGASIPVDGVIIDGTSSVNEVAISGESKPASKSVNDEVVAGTINQDGALTVKVTKLGEDTTLAGIMRLVAEAQASKSNTQVLADKAALWLTIIALLSAIVSLVVWLVAKDANFAIERAVTVLIIACPHALGLAIPLVVAISTTLSASNGLLVRKRLALEAARKLDVVLFDKTGTLTRGEHGVTDIWATKGYTKDDIIHLTASLEQNSEHIVGKGIIKYAQDNHVHLDKVDSFAALPGLGVKGTLHGHDKFVAASYRYITENNLKVPKDIEKYSKKAAKEGKTEVYLIKDGKKVVGAIALADIIRDEAKSTILSLKQLGIKTAMVTGDSKDVAASVAKQLGLGQYFAEVRPEDKASKVKTLQKQGLRVAMVGDGINDAPALTQADIGIAIGAGTDVAIKSADIILVKSDPRDVVKVIKLSKATYNKMLQNLVWATGYNVFAIPLAAGVLYNFGFILAPALGAILMSASTIVVAINAQLLRRLTLQEV